jgi:hypothetical protein
MPPRPDRLRFYGEVEGDYRVRSVRLVRAEIQGTNATELILDLVSDLAPADCGVAHPKYIRNFEVVFREQDTSDLFKSVVVRNCAQTIRLEVTEAD